MIHVNKGSGTGTFNGRIQNNFIGNAAIVGSGSEQAFGIYASARGAGGSHTTLINNNTVRQYFDRGILLEAGEGAAAFNATVTNNTVSQLRRRHQLVARHSLRQRYPKHRYELSLYRHAGQPGRDCG